MLQLSQYNVNHEFVQLNELKTRFLKDSYCERPCIYLTEQERESVYTLLLLYILGFLNINSNFEVFALCLILR